CGSVPANESQSCDDGNACTLGNVCQGGSCSVGTLRDCSAGDGQCTVGVCNLDGSCGSVPANESQSCDDGNACTLGNVCQGGSCSVGTLRDCSAGNSQCTVGVCNLDGSCGSVPANESQSCDDGNACTLGNVCQGGSCSVGTPRDCSAGDGQCTVGFCNLDGSCEAAHANQGEACSDGNSCTENSVCQDGLCLTGTGVDCSALEDDCNVGSCDQNGDCEAVAVDDLTICSDDGLACTANQCQSGVCAHPLLSGWCLINGGCYEDGAENPDNNCQVCDAFNPSQWSDKSAGAVCAAAYCDAGNSAFAAATCSAGECVQSAGQTCDEYLCVAGACNQTCLDDNDCSSDAHCDEDGSCSTENRAPVANAGNDQQVNDDDTVTLNGSASFDPDGDAITFAWVQISGATVTLSDVTTSMPEFIAPRAPTNGVEELVFELVVNDGLLDSVVDSTTVTVSNLGNNAPIAVITGPGQASAGEVFFLDGMASFDPDGDPILTYSWNLVSGTPAAVIAATGTDGVIEVTIANVINEDVTYRFSLVVYDGLANSEVAFHDVFVAEVIPTDDVGSDAGDAGADTGDTGLQDDVGADTGDIGSDIGDADDIAVIEPDTGDVGADVGGDVDLSDLGTDTTPTPPGAGTLAGSTCFCGSVNSQPTVPAWLLIAIALGAVVLARRRKA
nr:hypothetical protein [Lujinxingiaceae bacterium]